MAGSGFDRLMRTPLAVAVCVLALGAAACSHDYSPPASATTPAPLTGEHTLQGLIHQGGGLRFTGSGKTVDLTQVQINTAAKQLSANVDGATFMPVMDVQLATVNQTDNLVQAGVTLTLSSGGAQALGLDGLQPGMTVGTGVIQAKAGQ